MNTLFIETDCKFEFEGKEFSAGGAYLLDCSDGIRLGVVYVKETENSRYLHCGIVTTWHGEQIARCSFVDYRGNFCKMRRVSFERDGVKFIGDYCPDNSELCRVRSTKKVEAAQ